MEALLTVKEVAAQLKMTPRHIYRCISDGTLPSYKIGGAVRIAPEQLAEWLQGKRPYTKCDIQRMAMTHLATQ